MMKELYASLYSKYEFSCISKNALDEVRANYYNVCDTKYSEIKLDLNYYPNDDYQGGHLDHSLKIKTRFFSKNVFVQIRFLKKYPKTSKKIAALRAVFF